MSFSLTPFQSIAIVNFPFIEDTFEGISNYEMMSKIVEYLNDNSDVMLTLSEEQKKLYNGFSDMIDYVNNYFNTLDITTEINNKLDIMADNGTLANIINSEIFGELNNKVNTAQTDITTINNKINTNINNFKNLGGKCDGVTDDYTALTTALENARINGTKISLTGNIKLSRHIVTDEKFIESDTAGYPSKELIYSKKLSNAPHTSKDVTYKKFRELFPLDTGIISDNHNLQSCCYDSKRDRFVLAFSDNSNEQAVIVAIDKNMNVVSQAKYIDGYHMNGMTYCTETDAIYAVPMGNHDWSIVSTDIILKINPTTLQIMQTVNLGNTFEYYGITYDINKQLFYVFGPSQIVITNLYFEIIKTVNIDNIQPRQDGLMQSSIDINGTPYQVYSRDNTYNLVSYSLVNGSTQESLIFTCYGNLNLEMECGTQVGNKMYMFQVGGGKVFMTCIDLLPTIGATSDNHLSRNWSEYRMVNDGISFLETAESLLDGIHYIQIGHGALDVPDAYCNALVIKTIAGDRISCIVFGFNSTHINVKTDTNWSGWRKSNETIV